jgi:ribosome maturation factor RimP
METLRKELLAELSKITSPLGIRIVELQAMKGKRAFTITVVVDKGGKVSIEDCEMVTKLFNARLEVLELLRGANYSLQVSSPGTSRVFKSRDEYDIFRGREVRVVLKEPVERTNVLDGVLENAEGDSITLSVSGERVSVPFSNISKTRLHE